MIVPVAPIPEGVLDQVSTVSASRLPSVPSVCASVRTTADPLPFVVTLVSAAPFVSIGRKRTPEDALSVAVPESV